MNSANKKGNGNIRSCIGFILFLILMILVLSEFAPYANACEEPADWGQYDPWPYAVKETKEGK